MIILLHITKLLLKMTMNLHSHQQCINCAHFLTSLLTLGSADLFNICQPDLLKNDISILFLSVVPGLLTRLKIFSNISICVSSFVNCQFRSLLFGHLPIEVFPNDFLRTLFIRNLSSQSTSWIFKNCYNMFRKTSSSKITKIFTFISFQYFCCFFYHI